MPTGFGSVIGIYPESPAYQTSPAKGINVALVGQGQENVAVHAALDP